MLALPRHSRGLSGPPRSGGRLLRPVVAAAALLFLLAGYGIERDELLCEVAVVHLAQCCPNFPARELYCVRSGCDGALVPDLSQDRAQCLHAKSCAELQALGACNPNSWEPVSTCVAPCSAKVPACH